MSTLVSYDLNGKKLSFANWISNLSPIETPFTSMTGKEKIDQVIYQWQTDHLSPVKENACKEGDRAINSPIFSTVVQKNMTQILRKTVKVSDTSDSLANYGRGKEVQYQLEKAGKEIKRDLEWAFLNNNHFQEEVVTPQDQATPRRTAGFRGLVAELGAKDFDTGAVVHKLTGEAGKVSEDDIFSLTYNLFLAGSDADIIMYHPKHASKFSALQESTQRQRIFENTSKFSTYVSTLVDPLGQEYKLIPNRWMPRDYIYFFSASDWTQMILRAPQRVKLAKDGSYEKWMIEMEVGLRHRNPFASGILDLYHDDNPGSGAAFWATALVKYEPSQTIRDTMDPAEKANRKSEDISEHSVAIQVKRDTKIDFRIQTQDKLGVDQYVPAATDITILKKDGKEVGRWTAAGTSVADRLWTNHANSSHNGVYHLVYTKSNGAEICRTASVTIKVTTN